MMLKNVSEIVHPRIRLQEACSGFPMPPMPLKVVPKAICDPGNCSESRLWTHTAENRPMRVKESRNRDLMRNSETLHLFCYWTSQTKNLKTICTCTERTNLIYRPSKKIFIQWPNPFNFLTRSQKCFIPQSCTDGEDQVPEVIRNLKKPQFISLTEQVKR